MITWAMAYLLPKIAKLIEFDDVGVLMLLLFSFSADIGIVAIIAYLIYVLNVGG